MEANQNLRGLFSFFERNHFFDINKVYNDFIKNDLIKSSRHFRWPLESLQLKFSLLIGRFNKTLNLRL